MKSDLYDVIGHLKLLATTRRILVHVQSHAGPVMKLYLWDQAAVDFCKKFKSSDNTPSVILVTTVYPKRLGGTLALTSMTSSRVGNKSIYCQAEIFSYMKQGAVKDAFFVCTATIDDVVHDSSWYYIACSGFKTKATKGPTSLMCAKCGKNDVAGEPQYLAKIMFMIRHASELVSNYFEANGNKENGFEHNFSGRTRVITVTKVLSPSAPLSTQDPVADQISGSGNGTLATGYDVIEPSKSPQDSAEVGLKRMGDGVEIGNAKRSKDGN
ncbi:BnaAnng30050D [Brassica napus]|uniref:BnaAnng30050D protein n=1 Tax=Brassica napus TaxID=3708 RepID=A0A078JSF7_BRANA|nr:BnaAnng30050D [Brassica napus]